MVTAAHIQDRIYYGYGKCATRLGTQYTIYRANSYINPITPAFERGAIYGSFTSSWSYMKFQNWGSSTWLGLVDGRQLQKFDYLTNGQDTYYLADNHLILPLKWVQCNHSVRIERPFQSNNVGDIGYTGYEPAPIATIIADSLPVSIVMKGRGRLPGENLPTDSRLGTWMMYAPQLDTPIILVGDIIIDTNNLRYEINMAEITDQGWRFELQERGT